MYIHMYTLYIYVCYIYIYICEKQHIQRLLRVGREAGRVNPGRVAGQGLLALARRGVEDPGVSQVSKCM